MSCLLKKSLEYPLVSLCNRHTRFPQRARIDRESLPIFWPDVCTLLLDCELPGDAAIAAEQFLNIIGEGHGLLFTIPSHSLPKEKDPSMPIEAPQHPSYWTATTSRLRQAPLTHNTEADVCVVGAGI